MLGSHRLFKAAVLLLLVSLLAVACGNSGTGNSSAPTATATTASAPTATSTAASSGAVVQTASATIGGKSVTILTDTKGMTLYYRTSDTATSICSGACAKAWPPLLFSGSGTPSSSTTLPGTLSVVNNANGAQVAYQGHLLYTFVGDTASGQVNGQNKGGVWFAATTDLSAGGGGSATPTPTASGY